jgi:hypothetical protein
MVYRRQPSRDCEGGSAASTCTEGAAHYSAYFMSFFHRSLGSIGTLNPTDE